VEALVSAEWNGKIRLEHWRRWINGIENRAEGENLLVNYLSFEMYNREKGKIVYKNNWVTDKPATKENARLLVSYARAQWKIENENNNVLKHCGRACNTISDAARTMSARCVVF
jgi:hypothetical protein